jgi:hypothetical protein
VCPVLVSYCSACVSVHWCALCALYMRVCAPVGVLVPLLGVDVLQRASERVLCVFVSIQHPYGIRRKIFQLVSI